MLCFIYFAEHHYTTPEVPKDKDWNFIKNVCVDRKPVIVTRMRTTFFRPRVRIKYVRGVGARHHNSLLSSLAPIV